MPGKCVPKRTSRTTHESHERESSDDDFKHSVSEIAVPFPLAEGNVGGQRNMYYGKCFGGIPKRWTANTMEEAWATGKHDWCTDKDTGDGDEAGEGGRKVRVRMAEVAGELTIRLERMGRDQYLNEEADGDS
eukprot:920391-Rhodomonas_salina.1